MVGFHRGRKEEANMKRAYLGRQVGIDRGLNKLGFV
jgi:hypothetical protein